MQRNRRRRSKPPQKKTGAPVTENQGQALLRVFIDSDEHLYQETKNPVFAWRAYLQSRAAFLPVPEWVCQYLDRPAWQFVFWSMEGAVPKTLDPAIVKALELRRPGREGRGNLFDDASPSKATKQLALGVRRRMLGIADVLIDKGRPVINWTNKMNLSQAIEDVATTQKVSSSKVSRAWYLHKEFLSRRG